MLNECYGDACKRVNQPCHAEDEFTHHTSQGDFIRDLFHQFGIVAFYFVLWQDELELIRIRLINCKWLEEGVRRKLKHTALRR
jgi:hypothetical protein